MFKNSFYSKFSSGPNYVYIVKFIVLLYYFVTVKFRNPSLRKAGARVLSAAVRSQRAVIASGRHSAATVWHVLRRCCVLRLISERPGVWIFRRHSNCVVATFQFAKSVLFWLAGQLICKHNQRNVLLKQ